MQVPVLRLGLIARSLRSQLKLGKKIALRIAPLKKTLKKRVTAMEIDKESIMIFISVSMDRDWLAVLLRHSSKENCFKKTPEIFSTHPIHLTCSISNTNTDYSRKTSRRTPKHWDVLKTFNYFVSLNSIPDVLLHIASAWLPKLFATYLSSQYPKKSYTMYSTWPYGK